MYSTLWEGEMWCDYFSDKDMNMTPRNPAYLSYLFQLVFGLYMLVTTVVLINLLIAMMSDTYQRIQVIWSYLFPGCQLLWWPLQQQSDVEWKFGLAKLIRSMHRTDMSPSPINLVTTWLVYIFRVCKRGRSGSGFTVRGGGFNEWLWKV